MSPVNLKDSNLNASSVAAAVVLYNSEERVLDNIKTYINQVDRLYVIDNSDVQNDILVTKIKREANIEYHWLQNNEGIASALNKAASLSVKVGYSYLLMMDDDSSLPEDAVPNLLNYVNEYKNKDAIGIVSVKTDHNVKNIVAQSVWHCITSGSLLSLGVYNKCGPFMDSLFIDGVDHEYCYRIKQAGFDIITLNHILMNHRMGIPEELKVLNKIIYKWSSHNPIRSYYLVRNFLFILREYQYILPISIKVEVYYGVFKSCLVDMFLGKNKELRLRYIIKGIIDYRNGKLGKL